MKTHDVARALNTLARALRESENLGLESITISKADGGGHAQASLGSNAPAALALLVRLAGYSKAEWTALIRELELDVEVKATDSVRDLLGRLLKFLNDNRDIHTRLIEKAKRPQKNVSPELMKALSILMEK